MLLRFGRYLMDGGVFMRGINHAVNHLWENLFPEEKELQALFTCAIFYVSRGKERVRWTTFSVGSKEQTVELEEKGFRLEKTFTLWNGTPCVIGGCVPKEDTQKDRLITFLTAIFPAVSYYFSFPNEGNTNKYTDLLMEVTKKFHVSMRAGTVLKKMIDALKEVYPTSEVMLYLAQEWDVQKDLPEVPITYGMALENEKVQEVYLTARIHVENSRKGWSILYIPLRGQQGVYGVLQLSLPHHHVYHPIAEDFIKTLADMGGKALENRELYKSSRTLVKDLQLINETSHMLNSKLKVEETARNLEHQIKKFIPYGKTIFLMLEEDNNIRPLTDNFYENKELQDLAATVFNQFHQKTEAFIFSDIKASPCFQMEDYQSIMAIPMMQSREIIGTVIVLGEEKEAFTFHQFRLLQSLIEHSTLAFINASLQEKLELMVITDQLTQLYSRHYLDEKIRDSLQKDIQGTFLLLDIDNFKQVNDTHGHQVGDEILIQVANIIRSNIRSGDVAARWGGEELAVYLPRADLHAGKKVAWRIVENIARETNPPVTISGGVTTWKHGDHVSVDLLVLRADEALYEAKKRGKNQVVDAGVLTEAKSVDDFSKENDLSRGRDIHNR